MGREINIRVPGREVLHKRYLLPTGLLVDRLHGGKAIKGGHEVKAERERLEWETRRNKVIHLLALLLLACILLVRSPQLSVLDLFLVFATTLYVNVYPIFVQRYNRLRLGRLLGKKMRSMRFSLLLCSASLFNAIRSSTYSEYRPNLRGNSPLIFWRKAETIVKAGQRMNWRERGIHTGA